MQIDDLARRSTSSCLVIGDKELPGKLVAESLLGVRVKEPASWTASSTIVEKDMAEFVSKTKLDPVALQCFTALAIEITPSAARHRVNADVEPAVGAWVKKPLLAPSSSAQFADLDINGC